MAEQMSDSRRRERTDWLMGRIEDHITGAERLARHADDLGLDPLVTRLREQVATLDDLLGDMVTGVLQ